MTAPYSQDLRDRVLAAYDRGLLTQQIAETFQVSRAWARRLKQRRRETGETAARRMGGPGVIKVDRARLTELVREDPDATLTELRDRLGVTCAISTICVALKKLGWSFKKRSFTRLSRIGPMSSISASNGVDGATKRMPVGSSSSMRPG
jgi:transposase